MKVLLVTRKRPYRDEGEFESQLVDRLRDLADLGHEILVFTRWTGEARDQDEDLPARVEIRAPFKTFQFWEWPKALPMLLAWRPDVIHVLDPGLSKIERVTSVELAAISFADVLRIPGRLVSSRSSLAATLSFWRQAGAAMSEAEWLATQPNTASGGRRADTDADGSLFSLWLAGERQPDPVGNIVQALKLMRERADIELIVNLDRASLSRADRKRLQQAERMEAFGAGVGSRLKLIAPEAVPTDIDAAIVAGLEPRDALHFTASRLPPFVPLIASDDQTRLESIAGDRLVQPLVPSISWLAHSLLWASRPENLTEAWARTQASREWARTHRRDGAANQMSRLYYLAVSAGPS